MKTLFVGQNSIHVESLDSTNSYASEMLRQIELAEGSLIYTFRQEKGRGQRNNSWESEPNKNVALSIVLHPKFLRVDAQFLLTKTVSLAVADLMAELLQSVDKTQRVCIKWPNDIYVNDKKIAGILIENSVRENTILTSVIGIGINVNQVEFSAELNGVSLAMLLNKELELMSVVERLCEFIEARYLQLRSGKIESIDIAYLQRLYRLNEWSELISGNVPFEGKITGVSPIGKLLVALKDNSEKEFDLKEISFLK